MAFQNNNQSQQHLSIVEPLRFHIVHGDQITLSENNTRAIRDRLSNNLLFTNRPILPNEIVQLLVEKIDENFYGLIRIGLTTIDPASYTRETLPKSIPCNDNTREWFIPTPRTTPPIKIHKDIRFKYTAEGDIFLDYGDTGFVKYLTVSPINKDVWCVVDLNGTVAQVRLTQTLARVLANPVDRAGERYRHFLHQQQNSSVYYSEELSLGIVSMNNCDENSEITSNIAVKKRIPSSMTVDEDLKRCMFVVMQILDMDHTLSSYLTINCLIDGRISPDQAKTIDTSFVHMTVGDEIGIRVHPDGNVTFSCNNRHVKSLFNIDLTVNDNPNVEPTQYRLEFVMNGRVTGLRLIGLYRPTDLEARTGPVPVGGGCLSTVRHSLCPSNVSGLLLPCRHLCVCYDCGQALIDKYSCPLAKCRKPVKGCVRVYKD